MAVKHRLLAIDVGNTQIVLGMYEDDKLTDSWRISSSSNRSEDELGVVLMRLLDQKHASPAVIDGAILSSVVPPVTSLVEKALKKYFDLEPLIVGPGIRTGIQIRYESPKEVGADRIVNAVAAFEDCKTACVVVDFGTATTFDCVADDGAYLGGLICPGAKISLEALVSRAAKLPRIEIDKPERIIGQSTVEAMQAGLYYGYTSLVQGIVERTKDEMRIRGYTDITVLATGGLSAVFAQLECIDSIRPNLTLDGLHILYNRNQ